MFQSKIELHPSFHLHHQWQLVLNDHAGEVFGVCQEATAHWSLSETEIIQARTEICSLLFPDEDYDLLGFDGITVHFEIQSERIRRTKEIWCPSKDICFDYWHLIKWIWQGLYRHSSQPYTSRLEQLYSYFDDWDIPVFNTELGLKIFGSLCWGQEGKLANKFDSISHMNAPQIDMMNFQGTGTILYPVFKTFFDKCPDSIWLVNRCAYEQMKEAGIAEENMRLTGSNAKK